MDIFMIQNIRTSGYLVVIDSEVYVYKCEKRKFDQPFLCF